MLTMNAGSTPSLTGAMAGGSTKSTNESAATALRKRSRRRGNTTRAAAEAMKIWPATKKATSTTVSSGVPNDQPPEIAQRQTTGAQNAAPISPTPAVCKSGERADNARWTMAVAARNQSVKSGASSIAAADPKPPNSAVMAARPASATNASIHGVSCVTRLFI